MKIIGRTENANLVEATDLELANVSGYNWERSHPIAKNNGRFAFDIGASFQVHETFEFVQRLRQNQQKCADAAVVMKALSDMLAHQLPDAFLPPAQTTEKTDDSQI